MPNRARAGGRSPRAPARPAAPRAPPPPTARPLPDWATVHAEHQRPGVTRALLWLEYKAAHPDGYQYTQFCAHYGRWLATIDPVLRPEDRAGERVFIDYAGQTMPVGDPPPGEGGG